MKSHAENARRPLGAMLNPFRHMFPRRQSANLLGFEMNVALLCLGLLLFPLSVAAQQIGSATLVEGTLRVIRGAAVFRGVEGMQLRQGDMIETSDPGFTQLEFNDGTIVALGASTRLFLFKYGIAHAGDKAGEKPVKADLVLLAGWLKGEARAHSGAYHYVSPQLAAATKDGTLVVHATPEASEIFVESGAVTISEVDPNGTWNSSSVAKAGQFCTRRTRESLEITAHSGSAFLDSMPRAFRDTLSSRASRVAEKPAQLQRIHAATYAEIRPWLTMARSWRSGFVNRFQPCLKSTAFRNAVEEHLRDHPEWDPILHPEKYQSDAAAAPADSSKRR